MSTINPLSGLGGMTPVIRVSTEGGSYLTCDTQSYQMGASETSHDFKVTIGTHTVTASKSGQTKTVEVLVDEVALYPITISYGRLPWQFQEVEWIKSNGSQYIDIDYVATSISISEAKFSFDSIDNNANVVFANQSGFASDGFALGANWNKYWAISYGTSNTNTPPTSIYVNTIYVSKIDNNGKLYVDGRNILTGNGSINYNSNLLLFVWKRAETILLYAQSCTCYYIMFWDGSSIVRNLVPCYCITETTGYKGSTAVSVPSGTIGLYDLVDGRFYVNSGSGVDFTKGDDV